MDTCCRNLVANNNVFWDMFTNVLNFVFPFSQLASLRMKHSRRMPLKGQVLTATAVVGPFSGPQTTYHLWSC